MSVTRVIDVIDRAQTILQDTTNTRWSKQELLDWFNDAQLAVVNRRPDTYIKNVAITCLADTKQTIPADGLRLMRVLRNVGGRPIRNIPLRVLDDQVPDWHEAVNASRVDHYAYDLLDPKTFYLYPAPAASHEVEIIYSVAPAPIVISNFETDVQTLSLDDSYLNPILDWMLYRCYSKDADYTSNAQRAMGHLEAFRVSIGDKTQADMSVEGDPNG